SCPHDTIRAARRTSRKGAKAAKGDKKKTHLEEDKLEEDKGLSCSSTSLAALRYAGEGMCDSGFSFDSCSLRALRALRELLVLLRQLSRYVRQLDHPRARGDFDRAFDVAAAEQGEVAGEGIGGHVAPRGVQIDVDLGARARPRIEDFRFACAARDQHPSVAQQRDGVANLEALRA